MLSVSYKDLEPSLKIIVVGFIFILPVWFLDIVLFSKTFYKTHSDYISIVLAFCITIPWYIIQIFTALFFCNLTFRRGSKIKNEPFTIGALFGCASILSFTLYGYLYSWNLKNFIESSFKTSVWILVGMIIVSGAYNIFKPINPKVK